MKYINGVKKRWIAMKNLVTNPTYLKIESMIERKEFQLSEKISQGKGELVREWFKKNQNSCKVTNRGEFKKKWKSLVRCLDFKENISKERGRRWERDVDWEKDRVRDRDVNWEKEKGDREIEKEKGGNREIDCEKEKVWERYILGRRVR